ncbi:MAG: efflux RND transporter periplasmic adaptor subunit [Bacteroidales bacterium]
MKLKGVYLSLMLVFPALIGCQKDKTTEQTKDERIAVETQKIEISSTSKQLRVSGNIEGNKTVRLGFMVAGKINHISTDEGEIIRKGALLASLDTESYEIALEMADIGLDQMQDDYDRLKILHNRKSIAESDFVKASNGLRTAKAQQHLHAKNLKDCKLYSPISGVLLKKGVEEGEIIDKGIQIFAVSDIFTVKANAAIPEMELHYAKKGSKASVYVAALDSTFEGTITEVGTLADPETRTFPVKINLSNPKLLIRPGMTAEVQIGTDVSRDLLSIPISAVLHDLDNSAYVFVADTKKGQAYKRTVSLGKISGSEVEVVSGLSRGELIVTGGAQKLSNGSLIQLKN